MSYINDALRKAQKERDNRYGKFGGIITAGPGERDRSRKGRNVLVAAALIIVVAAALVPAVRSLRHPPPAGKVPGAAVSAVPAPVASPVAVQPDARAGEKAESTEKTVSPGNARKADPGRSASADVRYADALQAQRRGDLPRAQALYQEVLSLDAGHVRALNNLGVIYMALKQRDKAVEALGRAAALKKEYVDPYYNLACLYAQANDLGESLRYLKIAAAIDGNVTNWVREDADMKNVAASPEFKKIMEGQKN